MHETGQSDETSPQSAFGATLFRMGMGTMSFTPLQSRSKSHEICLRIEDAPQCDGSECGWIEHDSDGDLKQVPPHYHMIVSGEFPGCAPQCYAIRGESPHDEYDSD